MRVYLCGGDVGTGPTREVTDCPSSVHDWPLPTGFVDASVEAHWRLSHQWANPACSSCGLYGWLPGRREPHHIPRALNS